MRGWGYRLQIPTLKFQACQQVGTAIPKVLVLEQLRGSQGTLVVTCKQSLLDAAGALPSSLAEIREAAVVPGYVANVVADAVFVRFLGGLTGRAGKTDQPPLLL